MGFNFAAKVRETAFQKVVVLLFKIFFVPGTKTHM